MSNAIKILCGFGAGLSLILLSACGSQAPTSAPTLDLNPFRTEVASTVLAQVTQDLAQTPSITPIPSFTATTPPTLTSSPTQAATPLPFITATLPSGTQGAATGDKAQWISQTVADNTVFAPGETFTMTWRLRNVGITTWTTAYLIRFYTGDALGAPKEVRFGKTVTPGQTVDISMRMKAPASPGNYLSDWVMSTNNRSNFKEPFFLRITVALPGTPTPKS